MPLINELLSAQGRSELSLWRQSLPGNVKKVYDSISKTFVFLLAGNPSAATRLTTPPDLDKYLGLIHSDVVLQLKIPENKDFSFELLIRDDSQSRRRIQFSTFFREIQTTPDTARLPIGKVKKEKWCNLCVRIADLVRFIWPGNTFGQLDGLTVCANCSLLKILALKSDNDNEPFYLPPSCQLRNDLDSITLLISWDFILASQSTKKTRSPDTGLKKKHDPLNKQSDEYRHIHAEGIGLFQLQTIRRSSRARTGRPQITSAPSGIPRIPEKNRSAKRRPMSTESDVWRRRSASLPRIDKTSLQSPEKDSFLSRVLEQEHRSEQSRKQSLPVSKPPVCPRQAWRGSSALQHSRALRLKAKSDWEMPLDRPAALDLDEPEVECLEEKSGEENVEEASMSSIDYVLSQRLAAAIYGPDETVNYYSDSDTEPDELSRIDLQTPTEIIAMDGVTDQGGRLASGKRPQSILKTSDRYRRNHEDFDSAENPLEAVQDDTAIVPVEGRRLKRGTESNGRESALGASFESNTAVPIVPIDRRTSLERTLSASGETDSGRSSSTGSIKNPNRFADLPKPTLDVDELAVLQSMRRSNLDMSWMMSGAEGANKADGGIGRSEINSSMSLRRHEFDDEDSDSEMGSVIGPLNARGSGTPGPGKDMSLFSLEASGTQSILSSRLSSSHGVYSANSAMSAPTTGDGNSAMFPIASEQRRNEEDSAANGESNVASCPVMNLMFDPELNCYYHPDTKKYYQVASY